MIVYQEDTHNISADELRGFFVGWPNPPSPETHLKLLKKSDLIALAVDDQTNNVVGFVTAISDSVLAAYIPLLEVLPEYKGNGIGSELVKIIINRLDGMYMIDLLCDTDVQAFYSRLGMTEATGSAYAILIDNQEHKLIQSSGRSFVIGSRLGIPVQSA